MLNDGATGYVGAIISYKSQRNDDYGFRVGFDFNALFDLSANDESAINITNITEVDASTWTRVTKLVAGVDYTFGESDLDILIPALKRAIAQKVNNERSLGFNVGNNLSDNAVNSIISDKGVKAPSMEGEHLQLVRGGEHDFIMWGENTASGYQKFSLDSEKTFSVVFEVAFSKHKVEAVYIDGVLTTPRVEKLTGMKLKRFEINNYSNTKDNSSDHFPLSDRHIGLTKEILMNYIEEQQEYGLFVCGERCELLATVNSQES